MAVPFPSANPSPASVETSSALCYTFSQIADDATLATYRKPKELKFQDGYVVQVTSWADAAKIVIERIADAHQLPPLPFKNSLKGSNYFLHTSNVHGRGNKMLTYRTFTLDGATIYVDTHRSASNLAASVAAFLAAAGAPPDAVTVRLEPK